MKSNRTTRTNSVDHLIVETDKPFAAVKASLEQNVSNLNPKFLDPLRNGDVTTAKAELERGPELAIFEIRDHGGLLAMAGQPRQALQYEIGNPLTASKMTGHELFAGLYAPLRVILYENGKGGAVFEYDKPSDLFGQSGNQDIVAIARTLDDAIERAVLAAIQ